MNVNDVIQDNHYLSYQTINFIGEELSKINNFSKNFWISRIERLIDSLSNLVAGELAYLVYLTTEPLRTLKKLPPSHREHCEG